MMKKQFISDLENGKIPASENKRKLGNLISIFDEYNKDKVSSFEEKKHRWDLYYFKKKVEELKQFNFSKELSEHLIEVKQYLQDQDIDPYFNIKETNDVNIVSNDIKELESIQIDKEKYDEPDLNNFKPSDVLTRLIEKDSVVDLRNYLMNILNNFRVDFKQVEKEIHYVWRHKPAIFESNENSIFFKEIDKNERNWNIDYFNLQQVYLNRNFSLDRLLHLLNVRIVLMKKGDEHFQQIKAEYKDQKTQSISSNTLQKAKINQDSFIRTALLIGGAIGTIFLALILMFRSE